MQSLRGLIRAGVTNEGRIYSDVETSRAAAQLSPEAAWLAILRFLAANDRPQGWTASGGCSDWTTTSQLLAQPGRLQHPARQTQPAQALRRRPILAAVPGLGARRFD